MTRPANVTALLISLAYLIFSLLWILFSDRMLLSFSSDPIDLALAQTLKGWLFVTLSGIGLYLLLRLGYQRLADSEAYFRSLFDHAPHGIAIASPQGRVVRCNRAFERLLGYRLDELSEMSFADFTHPEDIERTQQEFRHLLAGEIDTYTLNKRYLHKEGHTLPVRLTASALFDGNGQLHQIIAMVEDISELYRQQEDLRRNRADLERGQRIAHIGSWDYALDSGAIRWSDETYRIFGLEPQSERIRYERLVEFVHPDDRQAHDQYLQRITQARPGEPIRPFSYRLVRPDGDLRYLQVFAEPHFAGGESPVRVFGTVQDVTARELTEDALRQSEERLSMALLVSHEGIWEWDLSDSAAWWNEEFGRARPSAAFGFKPPRPPEWLVERIHPDDRSTVEASLQTALLERDGKQWDAEYRFLNDQGEYQYVVDRAVITRDRAGRPHRVMGARLDMTETMQARLEFDRFFALSPDLLLIADLQGRIRRVNPACVRTLGIEPYEMVDRSALDLVHRDDRAATVEVLHKLEKHGTISGFENRLVAADGSPRWMQWHAIATPEDGLVYAVARDVSEQKRAQQQLAENEQRWTLALDGAGHGVWDWDAPSNKVFFSHGWKHMLGYADEEIGDTLTEWEQRVHPDDLADCYAELQRHFRGETPSYRSEHRMLCKDGSYKWVLDQGTVFGWTEEGKPRRVVGTHTDISSQKAAEQALSESEQRYELAAAIGRSAAWEIHLDRDLFLFDHNLVALLDLDPQQASDRLSDWRALVHPDDQASIDRALRRVLRGRSRRYRLDHRIIRRDGRVGWVSVSGQRVSGHKQRPLRIVGSIADITERKLAEQEALQHNQELESVFNALPDLFFRIAADGVILDYRASATSNLYRPPEQFLGKPLQAVMPAAIGRRFLLSLARLQECREPQTIEYSLDLDGGEAVFEARLMPMADSDQVIAVVRNITAARRAEHRLRASEARFRDLVESTPDWVWEVDAAGRYTYASPRCKDLLGYEPDAMLGKTPFDFMPPDEAAALEQEFRLSSAARANISGLINRNLHRDGHEVFFETSGVPILDRQGRLKGYRGIDRDITGRIRGERALRASEEKYRLLVENQTDLIVKVDTEGRYLFASPSYCRLFDKAEKDLLGNQFMPLVHEDDRERTAAVMHDLFSPPHQAYLEQRAMTKDGWRWLGWQDTAILDAAGQVKEIIGVGRDIHDRKLAEQALAENRNILRAMIDAVPFWISYFDRDKRYLIANKKYEQSFAVPLEQIEGRLWSEVLPPEIAAVHGPLAERCLAGESFSFEESPHIPGVGQVHVNSHYIPLRNDNGTVSGGVAVIMDITEQRKQELELRESEARYRHLVENMSDGVAVYEAIDGGADFVFVDHNHGGERISGLSRSAVIGKRVTEIFPSVREMGLLDVLRRVWETGQPHNHPISRYADDLIELWVKNYVFKLPNGQIVAIYDDVTESKRSAEALERSEQTFRSVFEQAAVGVALTEAGSGRILSSNRRFCDIVRRDGQELIGQSFLQLTHPDDIADEADLMMRLITGEIRDYSVEQRLLRGDDSIAWINLTVSPTWHPAGEPGRYIAIVEDISERRTAEDALRRELDKTNLLLATTSEGFILADARGRLREVNPAYCRLTGYSRDELLTMTIHGLQGELDGEEIERRIGAVLEAGQARFETRHRHRDGHLIDLEVGVSVLQSPDEPLIAAFVHDITERNRAAALLRRAHEQLEQRVAERTAELSVANQELESFTYSVSHDLRAPLRAIRGFSQALLEDYGQELAAGAKNFLQQIDTSGARMGELIDGLLTLSRSTRGELERETVDISCVAAEIAARLAQQEPQRQVRIEIQPGLQAEADLRLIKTLLNNLLENAWKYTAPVHPAEIRVYGVDRGGEMLFCVQDNGAGFDMAFANKLFEPFQRLHRQDEFPGIGIGLATVQRIVNRHGGWISGEGKPEQGASFCFTLTPGEREE